MDRRVSIRISGDIVAEYENRAKNRRTTLSEEIREALVRDVESHSLLDEVRKLRNDLESLVEQNKTLTKYLDYLIDKDKRKEYAESRVI